MGFLQPFQQKNAAQNTPASGTAPKQKINSLQGLRAVAFLAIFISHSRLGQFGCLGAWGVSVFFVLSGFLMIINYYPREKQPAFGWRFSWNKIKLLYPLHLITMLFSVVFALLSGLSPKKTALDMVLHSFFLQIWIPNERYYATLNGPSWYLCVSLFCYLCFPLILRFFKRQIHTKKHAVHGMLLLFSIELILSGLAFFLHRHDSTAWFNTQWITYYCPPVRLIDYMLGCFLGAFYLFCDQTPLRRKSGFWISCITLVFIILSLYVYYRTEALPPIKSVKYTLLFLPTSLLLIWTLLDPRGFVARLFSCPILVALGNLSPYTFLIHAVIIKFAYWGLPGLAADSASLVVLFSFLVTIGAALLYRQTVNRRISPCNRK